MLEIPRLLISAPHRSAGKTTVSIGLLDAFRRRGLSVQPFKKGPDYIDPMWLTSAARRDCRNLDFHMMGDENILRSFGSASAGMDVSIIEGNLGLFDGLDLEGFDSTAGLAKLLETPVILVVDSSRMNRGVAPLLFGYTRFDPELQIAGVVLNKVASARHEKKLRQAIDRYVGVEVLGVIPKSPDDVEVTERHLGLIPIKEDPALAEKLGVIGETVENNLDLDRILEIASGAGPLPDVEPCNRGGARPDIRIGVAMDRAFTFYYPENLEALEAEGAKLVPFSPLSDKDLPEVNGLYIGGGFPEVFMKELEANESMRQRIREEIEKGLPVYAECGGMMYLTRSIVWEDKKSRMVGALPCDVRMTKKPMGLGYVTLEATGACKWLKPRGPVNCHEFHHSHIENLEKGARFAWKVTRGVGIRDGYDGIVHKNILASYAHLHYCGAATWAKDFTALIRRAGMETVTHGNTGASAPTIAQKR